MPLEIESARSRAALQRGAKRPRAQRAVVVGLAKNMADRAVEATEAQFGRLVSASADTVPVRLRFYFLPEVPRGPAGLAHVNGDRYWSIDELHREPPDALIVTGTEPVAPLLSDKPYWERLRELLQWAQPNTASSTWPCLAALPAM